MWITPFQLGPEPPAPGQPQPGECIDRHSDFELALSLFILVGMVVSYLPQHFRIIHKGTSEGISPWFLLLGTISASSTFLNIVVLQWKVILCCGVLSLGPCLESILGIAQLGVQFVMFGLVLVLYLIYYPVHKIVAERSQQHIRHLFSFLPAQTEEWALSLLIAHVVAMHLVICIVVTIVLLAFVGGPENHWTSAWATFLGITSVVLATIQYVPQIHRTFKRKSVGALSIPMMMMQTPGAALLTLSLALRPGANWTTWIVYAVTGCLQGTLLVMCIYYHFQAKSHGHDDFDTTETEPLLAEDVRAPRTRGYTGPGGSQG
ncbi:hypothetical protein BC939DRAFT_453782 [Gamsiella multidivaricata]|uniref:uncharacterized protein n=1 Tax=Gamsiella multidivaricata TaxID=101098 RepID=UPI00221EAA70|nr:uncharacterized protein BC939DRAFT_453782 [Gamsiella multidivaricata]KAI7822616.1 hypothetical protein BC939DRAFT_453782 [Gamsiella multidivaricata]